MLRLAYRNLRRRPVRTLLTALAIALGVGMILAMRIVAVAAAQASGEARAGRLAGADLEVSSATGAFLRDDLAGEIAERPEVEGAAPLYRRPEGTFDPTAQQAALDGRYAFTGTGLLLLGVDPAAVLTPYELAAGTFLSAPSAAEVLLPRPWAEQHHLHIGSRVTLTTARQTHTFTLTGLLQPGPHEALGPPTAWLPLETMQAAFDTPDAATAVLVRLRPDALPDPARDQLQEDLGPLYLVTSPHGSAESGIISPMVMIVDAALPFASIAVLAAGAFLVYNAFAITLSERRREIGQLRTLGMTRWQVLRQVFLQATLVALLGAGLGLPLGTALGRGMIALFVGFIQGYEVPDPAWPLEGALLAVGAGLLVTLAVTWTLARQAGRVSPLEALRTTPQGHDRASWYTRWGWVGAMGCLGLYVVLNIVVGRGIRQATTLNLIALWFLPPFVLAGAALFAVPLGVRGALWLAQRSLARWRIAPKLATGNLNRQQGRAALTTATLTIGLMLVVALAGMTLVEKELFRNILLPLFEADFLLVPPSDFQDYATRVSLPSLPPYAPALERDLEKLAAKADVGYVANIQLPGYGSGPALDNGWALTLDLVRDNAIYQPVEGSWAEADHFFAQGLALTLPEIAARRLDAHPGDVVMVDTYEGRFPFTVAMVGGPLPLVTSEVGRAYFHSYPLLILVNTPPGMDRAALEEDLCALAEAHTLAFTADMGTDFSDTVNQIFDTALALFAGLTSIAGLVAGLSIANTLVAAVIERWREIGVLRALGMTQGQVRRLVATEAGLLGLTGAVLAALAGLAMTLAFGQIIALFSETVGMGSLQRIPLPWPVAAAALVAGPAMAVLAGLYPAARAARVDPAEAMRGE